MKNEFCEEEKYIGEAVMYNGSDWSVLNFACVRLCREENEGRSSSLNITTRIYEANLFHDILTRVNSVKW